MVWVFGRRRRCFGRGETPPTNRMNAFQTLLSPHAYPSHNHKMPGLSQPILPSPNKLHVFLFLRIASSHHMDPSSDLSTTIFFVHYFFSTNIKHHYSSKFPRKWKKKIQKKFISNSLSVNKKYISYLLKF